MENQLIFEQGQLSNINFQENFLGCLFDSSLISDIDCPFFARQHLHENEYLIFEKRKKIRSQKEYIASRYMIKNIVAKWHGCNYERLFVDFDESNNRLEVFKSLEKLPYCISVSHSRGQVLVAVTRENIQVGADLEYIDTERQTNQLVKHFFHPKEKERIELNDNSGFYKLWTLKEAIAKIRGQSVMAVIAEDTSKMAESLHSVVANYNDFAIAIVTSKAIKSVVINVLAISQLAKNHHA